MPSDHSANRGAVSRRLDFISASGIRRFFETEGVISLGVGQPDFVTPPGIREAAIRSIEEGHTAYTSNWGIIELRQEISRLERAYGITYDPETEIIVTTGVSEGMNIATQAILDEGDEVLSPEPSYVAYMPNVVFAGGRFVTVPTSARNGFNLEGQELEDRIEPRSKAIMFGNPSNPTGLEMSKAALNQIAAVARKHDLFVIADEIYDRLIYDNVEHVCFASLPGMKERTILLGGFSKFYAMTGFRLGWVCAPAELADAMMRVHQYIMMSAPTAAQYAALEALQHGEEDARGMLAEYARRRELVIRSCREIGLDLVEPNAGFYAFPSIRISGMDDETFADRLIDEEKVAVVPGSTFGPSGRGHVRICYAQDYALLEEAFKRIGRFVNRYRSGTK